MKELLEKLEYRDGNLYWAETRCSRAVKGQLAGAIDGKGYRHINFKGKFYRVHRLVFFMFHGYLPPEVDHINRDRQDNRIENLRASDKNLNKGNSGMHAHNTSGFRGVSRNSRSGKWHAQIKIHGKQTYLGRFDTPEEAAEVYDARAKEVFGEHATLNFA